MAKEKEQSDTPVSVVKEKMYEVRLSRTFQIPKIKGVMKTGVVYMRGGYKFCDKPCGENENGDFVIVPESELHKFKMAENIQFKDGEVKMSLDPNLTMREVK